MLYTGATLWVEGVAMANERKELRCTSAGMTTLATTGPAVQLPPYVSLKRLAAMLDSHRSSVRRWLDEAGIQPVAFGSGPKGAIRYRGAEITAWLESRKDVP